MLRNEGDSNWTTEQILNWADNNKIPWIQGSDDDEDYDTYVKSMNATLSKAHLHQCHGNEHSSHVPQ